MPVVAVTPRSSPLRDVAGLRGLITAERLTVEELEPVVAVVAFVVSLAAGGRGRRLAGRALGAALAAGLALVVVGVAAELVDLGLR